MPQKCPYFVRASATLSSAHGKRRTNTKRQSRRWALPFLMGFESRTGRPRSRLHSRPVAFCEFFVFAEVAVFVGFGCLCREYRLCPAFFCFKFLTRFFDKRITHLSSSTLGFPKAASGRLSIDAAAAPFCSRHASLIFERKMYAKNVSGIVDAYHSIAIFSFSCFLGRFFFL